MCSVGPSHWSLCRGSVHLCALLWPGVRTSVGASLVSRYTSGPYRIFMVEGVLLCSVDYLCWSLICVMHPVPQIIVGHD